MPIQILKKYFPLLNEETLDKFLQLDVLFRERNNQINLVSRRDAENLIERHILHSLAIAKIFTFPDSAKIIDIGTGGGFPGIPLALFFNKCDFTLIDSIGKKINVVNDLVKELNLNNVKTVQIRSEQYKGNFDYIVSRAVTNLPFFYNQTHHLVRNGKGIVYLKGGDFKDELLKIKKKITLYEISDYYEEEFFETKKIVFIQT